MDKKSVIDALKQRYGTDVFDVGCQGKNASFLIQTEYGFLSITNLITAQCVDISVFTDKAGLPKVSFWSKNSKTLEGKSMNGVKDVVVISSHPLD